MYVDKTDEGLRTDVFGKVNEGNKYVQDSYNTKGSCDIDSIRTNLKTLAMKSTYTLINTNRY